ncbi:MAG: glycoside hydrolase family 27 protein [Candidatus Palauibacterales bacterium]|nr:glycoside hydrolase family 27 protein [Candidatus Palauibacterales bacterium]
MKKTGWLQASLALCLAACVGGDAGTGGAPEETPGAPAGSVTLAATPPMGFNTWNRFACDVSEELVRGIADAMVASGMRDAGYEYVVIDDCWQVERGTDDLIMPDPERFPSGMKALADYVHDRGLKFGVYTDAGPQTCQGRPGSYGFEEIDAVTYAEWGVDYVKVDWCHADSLNAPERYARFREAFDASGRDMVLSICEWGRNLPWEWAAESGQLWRTTADISDDWESVKWILEANNRHHAAAGPGHWNDPDMLEVGNGGMALEEYRAHFSLWAMMAAPLMAGNDLREMSDEIRAILTNAEVIAVDQDPLGVQGKVVLDRGYGFQVWAKPLADGAVAVALLNQREAEMEGSFSWHEIGLDPGPATVRDLWRHEDSGVHVDDGTIASRFRRPVPGHGIVMLRVTPIVEGEG